VTDADQPASTETADVPEAVLRPERRLSWAWLVPLLAVLLAGWLGYAAWQQRGMLITVQLEEAHGLKPGDVVRYQGTTVGEVRELRFTSDLGEVLVTVSLKPAARDLARRGSRFWVVRPQLGLGGVAGLETIVGPRYLAVLPGSGEPRRFFVGLESPPVVESIAPGDLEIVLQADQRRGLRVGVPVMYRGVRVGTVMSVGLASDAGGVEARVHIEKAFAPLIRRDTRFWDSGGIDAEFGITGLSLRAETIETVLLGGVTLATPPDAGPPVRTGHRFVLSPDPDEDWLEWEPVVAIGSSMLPPGAPSPSPLLATIGWEEGRWIRGRRSNRGWVLQTDAGLFGPRDLLQPGVKADRATAFLEVAGQMLALDADPVWQDNGLALIEAQMSRLVWRRANMRAARSPEDCLAIADPAAAPLPLAAARLSLHDRSWRIDEAVPIDATWHGACVLARGDGRLVGLLLVEDDVARVALLPEGVDETDE
jgi:hypothetical protein